MFVSLCVCVCLYTVCVCLSSLHSRWFFLIFRSLEQPPCASYSTGLQSCPSSVFISLFTPSSTYLWRENGKSLTMFFPNAFHVQKIWPWNHYADETASKWARLAYRVLCGMRAAVLKGEEKKKRLTNSFKFILYRSPSSPPSLTPWDAGSWRCFPCWDSCRLSIRL